MRRDITVKTPIVAVIFVAMAAAASGTTARQTRRGAAGASTPLEGTYWRATELAGRPTPSQEPAREARLTIAGDRLELPDRSGARPAVFTAQSSGGAIPRELTRSSWRLVAIHGADETRLATRDRARYTIEFDAGGRLTARIDCNSGRGTWTARGNRLELSPLALTRKLCPAGSLHDRIAREWPNLHSYRISNGHLFLAVDTNDANGVIYEFEPVPNARSGRR